MVPSRLHPKVDALHDTSSEMFNRMETVNAEMATRGQLISSDIEEIKRSMSTFEGAISQLSNQFGVVHIAVESMARGNVSTLDLAVRNGISTMQTATAQNQLMSTQPSDKMHLKHSIVRNIAADEEIPVKYIRVSIC